MKYSQILKDGMEVLQKAGVPEAKLDAWYLFSECFEMSRADYFMRQQEEAGEWKFLWEKWESFLWRRSRREPLQYILGKQEFMGFSFFVTPSVLIPRQDTEILVEKALSVLMPGDSVLDVCTGSGCILLSLAKKKMLGECVGADISEPALLIAQKNADALGAEADFRCSDLFEKIEKGKTFRVITCNPPYITREEMKELMPEVAEYEPHQALFGGEDGLEFYRKVIRQAAEFLEPGGSLIFEIGCRQAADVSGMLWENGYENVEVIQDLAGLDRVAAGVWKG